MTGFKSKPTLELLEGALLQISVFFENVPLFFVTQGVWNLYFKNERI